MRSAGPLNRSELPVGGLIVVDAIEKDGRNITTEIVGISLNVREERVEVHQHTMQLLAMQFVASLIELFYRSENSRDNIYRMLCIHRK